ncbi:MAG: hypothetical protein ACRCW1_02885 [Anaerotignaceae bacterium]
MVKDKTDKKELINNYVTAQKELFKYFNCNDEYFLKTMQTAMWNIKNEGDFYFLYYWEQDEKRKEAVVVKKNGEPQIFKTAEYTMVIGIDCVKIGFVFKNENKVNKN